MFCETRPHPELRTRPLPHRWPAVLLAAALLLLPAALTAQPGRGGPGGNPLKQHVFPPTLVMTHQEEIGLSAEQRQEIIAEVQAMEADLVPLRFEVGETTQEVARALSSPRVDEDQVLALVDRVTELEGEIKKRHLTLVIRIKNLLSPEQQARLRQLRRAGRR